MMNQRLENDEGGELSGQSWSGQLMEMTGWICVMNVLMAGCAQLPNEPDGTPAIATSGGGVYNITDGAVTEAAELENEIPDSGLVIRDGGDTFTEPPMEANDCANCLDGGTATQNEDGENAAEAVCANCDGGEDYSLPINEYELHAPWDCGAIVSIPDDNLLYAIQSQLGMLDSQQLTGEDMLRLESLDLHPDYSCGDGGDWCWWSPRSGIRSLSGIQCAINLRYLIISSIDFEDHILDLAPLAYLEKLSELRFANQVRVGDFAALSKLMNLTFLLAERMPEVDMTSLAYLPKLKDLYLRSCEIIDIRPITHNRRLETLDLSDNAIRQIDGLNGLLELRTVELSMNPIRSIEPLVRNLGVGDGDSVGIKGIPCKYVYDDVRILRDRGVIVRTECDANAAGAGQRN